MIILQTDLSQMGLTTTLLVEIKPPNPSLEESTIRGFYDGESQPSWLAGASPKEAAVSLRHFGSMGWEWPQPLPGFGSATLSLQKVFFLFHETMSIHRNSVEVPLPLLLEDQFPLLSPQ